ncbi:MAG: hypothetical protein M0R17_04715 [Candidatus Omnitrophica bacterium]|jgi:hypothetical protein|nr:hypothetical protein [Candidatus Omnitrophota bacterium]
MKQFIKQGELKLIGSGYLVNSKEEPVTNSEFVYAQKQAEFVVVLAEKAKGKDFKGKDADSMSALKDEVWNLLNGNKTRAYITAPTAPKRSTTEKLKEEALAFIGYQEDVEKTEKVNNFLNKFNSIAELEDFGLYFSQPDQPVKLNKIYTIKEIVASVTSVIDLL